MVASIGIVMFRLGQRMNALSVMRMEANPMNQPLLVTAAVPNQILDLFQQWSNGLMSSVVNHQQTIALGNILQQAVHAIPPLNNQNQEFNENLAVIVIDGALVLGIDSLETANEFNRRDITLVFVAVTTPPIAVWDYYRMLADYTGGICMLLENAAAIISSAIVTVINGEDTLRQVFCQSRVKIFF